MTYRFYAELPAHFNSKSGCKTHEPFTRSTLERIADPSESFRDGTRGVDVIALPVPVQWYVSRGCIMNEVISKAVAGLAGSHSYGSASDDYLRTRCVRISRDLARRLDPSLFTCLES